MLVNITSACPDGKKLFLTSAQETYGKLLYAMAFFGVYLGSIIESRIFNNNYPSEDLGPESSGIYRFIRMCFFIALSGIPLVPLSAGSFFVSKQSPFMMQAIFKFLLPPIVCNIYLFGFSRYLVTALPCYRLKEKKHRGHPMQIEVSGMK